MVTGRISPRVRRRAVGAVAAIGAVTAIVWASVASFVNQVPVADAATIRISLVATRDMGALPTEATWCGAVGTLGAPEHAYKLDEASGNLTDCSGNGLTLTAAGTPRYKVVPGVPVAGLPVDYTSENGIASDGSGRFTGTDTPAAVATITFIYRAMRYTALHHVVDWGQQSGAGYKITVGTTGVLGVLANLGTAQSKTVAGGFVADTGAINCVTITFNGASTVGWINGTAITWNLAWADYGSTTAAVAVALGSRNDGAQPLRGALFRYRLDHAAGTLADHNALCGTFTYPLRSDHAAYADTTFSHSGGTKCFQTGATSGTCMGPGAMGYGWDGTANQWMPVDSRVNRVLYNSQINCVNWTCSGLGGELLTDGDMEAAGTAAWTPANSATLTKDVTAPHGGAQNLRVAYNGVANPGATQGAMVAGKYYKTSGWGKSDGTWAPRVVHNTTIWTGTTGAGWQAFSVTHLRATSINAYGSTATAAGFTEFDDLSIMEVFPTVTEAIAPDGSLTAAALDFVGAETIGQTVAGYTNNATVYPRVAVKCAAAAGTLTWANAGGTGSWAIDCAYAGMTSWNFLHAAHPAVTAVAWTASAGGVVTPTFSGADASIWMPTVTEVDGYSLVPTLAAAVTTGDSLWSIANALGKYYLAGDTVTTDITLLGASPACWVTGDPLYLTGTPGSECTGIIRSIEVSK